MRVSSLASLLDKLQRFSGRTCPACGAGILSLKDTAHGGFWHVCSSCYQFGDSIELAEASRGLTTKDAFQLLAGNKPFSSEELEAIEEYKRRRVRQKIAAAIWSEASQNPPESATLKPSVRKAVSASQRWQTGGGRVVGNAPIASLERLFPDQSWPRKKSQTIAIQPLFDLPGRIAAFRVELSLKSSGWRLLSVSESPGCLFSQLLPEMLFGKSTIGVLDSHELAMHLQLQGLNNDKAPCLISTETPDKAYELIRQLFQDRDVNLLAEASASSMFALARKLDVKICVRSDPSSSSVAALRDGDDAATIWSRRVRGMKRPVTVVAELAEAGDLVRLDELLSHVDDRRELLLLAAQRIPEAKKSILSAVDRLGLNGNAATVDGRRVVVDAGRWIADDGEVVFGGQIRLVEILHQPAQGKTWYSGEIHDQDRVLPFCVEKQLFEKDPFKFAQDHAMAHGSILAFRNSWRSRAMSLILGFSTPSISKIPSAAGWSLADGAFVFGDFRVLRGGSILRLSLPAASIRQGTKTEPLTYRDQEALASLGSSAWSAVLLTVHAIVSGARSKVPVGAAVFGRGADSFVAAALAAGCDTKEPGELVCAENGFWPSVVDFRDDRKGRGGVDAVNSLAVGEELASLATAINPGWSVVEVAASSPIDERAAACIDALIGDLVHWFATHHLSCNIFQASPWTLDDSKELLRKFCVDRGLSPPRPRATVDRLACLERLLSRLLSVEGFIEDEGKKSASSSVRLADETAIILAQGLHDSLTDRKANHVTDAAITDVLAKNELLVLKPRIFNDDGWTVRRDWIERLRQGTRPRLAEATS